MFGILPVASIIVEVPTLSNFPKVNVLSWSPRHSAVGTFARLPQSHVLGKLVMLATVCVWALGVKVLGTDVRFAQSHWLGKSVICYLGCVC